jgi:CheY-like chemotaxis protein/MinD-like ATPase involved in chromosome partitioning or flagellar assembly
MAEKVLIVDDDGQTLRLVGLMLERQGYKVVIANNGFQGLRSARIEQPDAILLDVMMPDMDGYEVTRLLRKNPETTHIPILMFTARSQMEDKLTGYEAGVDEYLTKPIHPAELIAHLRAVLARHPTRESTSTRQNRGYTIGLLSAKGGLGVSTLALNLAITYHQRTKRDVIAAELRPGQGTWNTELALDCPDGLSNLLSKPAMEINAEEVEKELVRLPYGIRLLLASTRTKDAELMARTSQFEALIDTLPLLSRLVLLDIGTPYILGADKILSLCDEIMVVTEPFPSTVHRTRSLVEDLAARGFGKDKTMTVISVNRVRADVQISLLQMQEIIKMPVAQVIPPVPEAAFQAASRSMPLCQVQVSGVFTQQLQNLIQMFTDRVPA